MSNKNIKNKNIVMTGASGGFGLEMVKRLADPKLNNTILAVARTAEEKLDGLAPNVIPFNADIGSEEGIESIFEKAESLFPKIDIFFNNAGFPYIERYDYTDWDRLEYIFDVNTLAPIYMYSRYLKHLNGRPGHLAYTISVIGRMALPGYALYTSTKYGLHGFQQAIRLEMPKNVKLTCLYPVGSETGFFVAGSNGADIKRPWPLVSPEYIADLGIKGLKKNKETVFPWFWVLGGPFFQASHTMQNLFWGMEKRKMRHNFKIMYGEK